MIPSIPPSPDFPTAFPASLRFLRSPSQRAGRQSASRTSLVTAGECGHEIRLKLAMDLLIGALHSLDWSCLDDWFARHGRFVQPWQRWALTSFSPRNKLRILCQHHIVYSIETLRHYLATAIRRFETSALDHPNKTSLDHIGLSPVNPVSQDRLAAAWKQLRQLSIG